MSKYTTEPIDYTGCHPVIAEHLKRGETILCKVRDREGDNWIDSFMVYGYRKDAYYPYSGCLPGIDDNVYKYAEPIAKTRKVLISPEKAVIKLIENGWKVQGNQLIEGRSIVFIESLSDYAGEEVKTPWFPDYLFEEVED